MNTGVRGTYYCDEDQLKNYCRREYGWRGEDQVGIDKKNKRWWNRGSEMEAEADALSNGRQLPAVSSKGSGRPPSRVRPALPGALLGARYDHFRPLFPRFCRKCLHLILAPFYTQSKWTKLINKTEASCCLYLLVIGFVRTLTLSRV